MPISDWLDLMPQTVTVQRVLGLDSQGAQILSSPNTYQARINNQTRMVRQANGDEVVARGRAWLATVDPITTRDKVILDDGTVPLILVVNVVPDEDGPLYTSIDFA